MLAEQERRSTWLVPPGSPAQEKAGCCQRTLPPPSVPLQPSARPPRASPRGTLLSASGFSLYRNTNTSTVIVFISFLPTFGFLCKGHQDTFPSSVTAGPCQEPQKSAFPLFKGSRCLSLWGPLSAARGENRRLPHLRGGIRGLSKWEGGLSGVSPAPWGGGAPGPSGASVACHSGRLGSSA